MKIFLVKRNIEYYLLLRRFFYWRNGCAKERGSSGCSISTDEGVRPAAFLRPKTWRQAECSGRGNAKAALLQVPGTFVDGRRRRRIIYPTPRGSSAPRATDCKSVIFKPFFQIVISRERLYVESMHQWMTSHQYVSIEFKTIKTIFFVF